MLREHRDQYVEANIELRSVGSCHVYEDVPCVECDFRMIPIDYRRHGAYNSFRIVDHRIDRRISNDWQISRQVPVVLFMQSGLSITFGR